MKDKGKRTLMVTHWLNPVEHAAIHWLSQRLDRPMSWILRRLVADQVRYERRQCKCCPTCGAALSPHDGAISVQSSLFQ